MTALLLIMRTGRSALLLLQTSRPHFSRADGANIAWAALHQPETVASLSKICPIAAGFDL